MNRTILLRLGIIVCLLSGLADGSIAQPSKSIEKAQIGEPASKSSENEEADNDKIMQMSFDELSKYHRTKMRAYSKRYRAAPSAAEKRAVFKTIPSVKTYKNRLIELINEKPGSDDGLEIVDWWYRAGGRRQDPDTITRLILKNYSSLESIEKYVPQIARDLTSDEATQQLSALIEGNPFDTIKASATYQLHELRRKEAKTLQGKAAESMDAEVKLLRASIFNQYAKEASLSGAKYVDLIEAVEFSAKLEIGQPVPDIVGTDLDGVEFRLSDYDGKVRVISFWGNW